MSAGVPGQQRRRLAVCGNHAGVGLSGMESVVMKVVKVGGRSKAAGEAVYTCECGRPAEWLLREVRKVPRQG